MDTEREWPELRPTIDIHAKEWFDRINGNSYFSARVSLNGVEVARLPFQYGYGDHFQHESFEELDRLGYLTLERYGNGATEAPWQWSQRHSVEVVARIDRDQLKRTTREWGTL